MFSVEGVQGQAPVLFIKLLFLLLFSFRHVYDICGGVCLPWYKCLRGEVKFVGLVCFPHLFMGVAECLRTDV